MPYVLTHALQNKLNVILQGLRRNMETVIEFMMDSDGRGIKRMYARAIDFVDHLPFTVLELVKPPDLNQARVNKCLIALVNRKIVHKDNVSVSMIHPISFLL